jgi:hypothetical protein
LTHSDQAAVDLVIGLLLLTGKLKLVINYPEDEQTAPWPDPKDEEKKDVDNYVKPLEQPKPPTLLEAPKRRRGRPRKSAVVSEHLPTPPLL